MIVDITALEKNSKDIQSDVPLEILSNPALLFLYYRVEQILGIKTGSAALIDLNKYIERQCGSTFIQNPAAYEFLLTSREKIFDISNILTVNETYFFREGVHFDLLADLLPELIKIGRPLQICCAAVSIGCEAYSIAMLLDYYEKKGLDFDYTIDAFDVSADSIETAKNARYTLNSLRGDGSSWKFILDEYLTPDGDEYIVTQNIRRKVRFFTHNIMRGLDKQYDIIFFRNSLIYFSSKNRHSVLNNLSDSLFNNGLLFLGISETASVNHPLLVNRHSSDVFYFQKTGFPNFQNEIRVMPEIKRQKTNIKPNKQDKPESEREIRNVRDEIHVSCSEINALLETEDGKQNAFDVISIYEKGDISSISGSRLAAASLYFLNTQNYENADKILKYLEKRNSGVFTRFLRGEYYFHQEKTEEAEKYYLDASIKDRYFWPAFYRIAAISSDGNRTRYEYKIRKTIESIELVLKLNTDGSLNYECFLGGFSPDYFSRILEKKLS
ncbi:MAG: hypothetical protein FWB95_00070 [Treponema sp.]|nr:hypothetical protein [Treponema sp.]